MIYIHDLIIFKRFLKFLFLKCKMTRQKIRHGGDIPRFSTTVMPQPPGDSLLANILTPIIGTILPLIGSVIVGKIIQETKKRKGKDKKNLLDAKTQKVIMDEFERLSSKQRIGEAIFNPMLISPPKRKPKKQSTKRKPKTKARNTNQDLSRMSIATLGQVLGMGMIEM